MKAVIDTNTIVSVLLFRVPVAGYSSVSSGRSCPPAQLQSNSRRIAAGAGIQEIQAASRGCRIPHPLRDPALVQNAGCPRRSLMDSGRSGRSGRSHRAQDRQAPGFAALRHRTGRTVEFQGMAVILSYLKQCLDRFFGTGRMFKITQGERLSTILPKAF